MDNVRQLKRKPSNSAASFATTKKTKNPTGSTSQSGKAKSVHDRANQFKKDSFVVSGGRLFCDACRHEFKIIRSHNLKSHIASVGHRLAMERAYHEQERQQRISRLFEESTSLTKECKFRRFEVTRALLSRVSLSTRYNQEVYCALFWKRAIISLGAEMLHRNSSQ